MNAPFQMLALSCVLTLPALAQADSREAALPSEAPPSPSSQPPAQSEPPQARAPVPPPPPAQKVKRIGIGYKMGNGIGFAGADLFVMLLPNVVFDFQLAALGSGSNGFAAAPALQGYLRPRGNSPYVGVGLQHVRASSGDVFSSGTGFFGNIGYEWKWDSGLGVQLGGGVQYLDEITASNGDQSITLGGGANPNLEFGIRYRFL